MKILAPQSPAGLAWWVSEPLTCVYGQPRPSHQDSSASLCRTPARGGAVLRPVPDAELELSPEEQRVLERKLKKERKKEERQRLREAGLAAQHPPARRSGAELALDYLCTWAQKHKNWRFQKTRQTWLLLHMYDRDKVPDEHFSTMLAYLEGLQGRARELTVQKAEALMRELDEEDPDPLLPGRVQRIRQTLLGRRQL
nr:uncharacterized protein C7orf50 homolog isoform X2 [Macaca nemestrina]